jgi:crossover junction endodeoxyribonuclease RuvC
VSPALILGIDPGSRFTGWAVIGQEGRRIYVVESGTIRLPARGELSVRLAQLQIGLETMLDRLLPQTVAVEDIFTARNARSALHLGHARGVALAAAGRRGLPVFAYPPATVKQAVCGHGRAEKSQIQRMVQVLLSLSRAVEVDEADAMAVAICHALRSRATAGRRVEGSP